MISSRILALCLICVSTLLLSGCPSSTNFVVKVDSISDTSELQKRTYILIPGSKEVASNNLQFKEYSRFVKKALHSKGYIEAKKSADADLVILMNYGISDPKVKSVSGAVPIFGQTGVASSSTSGTVNTYGNYGSYSSNTTYTPTYGVTGAIPYTKSYNVYTRYLVLDANDLKVYNESDEVKQIWRTTVTSSGSSGDLRRVFPVMVAASADFMGTNTGQQVQIDLGEDDKRVLSVKGIKPRPSSVTTNSNDF